MDTAGVSRRQPPPTPSSPASPSGVDGNQEYFTYGAPGGGGGGWGWSLKAWGAPSPLSAGTGESRAFKSVLVVFACLSVLLTLIFVSRDYRAPLTFVSGFYGGSTSQLQHPHQQLLADGPTMLQTSTTNTTTLVVQLSIAVAPSPSPTSSKRLSHATPLHQVATVAPSPAPVGIISSYAKLHNASIDQVGTPPPTSQPDAHDVAPSPSPTSREKPSHAMPLHKVAAAAPSPAPAAIISSVAKLHNASIAVGTPAPTSHPDAHDDELFGGLLPASFDGASCQSRYQSFAYRKASPHKPSPYLLQKLRKYEALHKRCGPLTRFYTRSIHLLKPDSNASARGARCKYVVWNPENGLGNRMLSIASTFLYALLTGRVLLVEWSTDLASIFCEPFPKSTWLLPHNFPLKNLPLGQKYPKSFGNLLRANKLTSTNPPAFVYAHLSNDYDDYDMRFYCEDGQFLLEKIPWMVLRSDQYFVPALFINSGFERELGRMFPEKEAVFHHLGRYLFHPSDKVWGLITSYYEDHLAAARQRLGIQIRVFYKVNKPFDLILRQILNCTVSKKLLPEVDHLKHHVIPSTGGPSKAVLLASLHREFYDRMREMYSEHEGKGGEVVSVHQPSHEEEQQTGTVAHDEKALAEMYLLSLTDELVTSSWSTFGYVAQALGGMTPWVLAGPVIARVPEPTCYRDLSQEPCFHFPPSYDCKGGGHTDVVKLVPYTRHCKDFRRGVKLVDVRQ